MQDKWKNLLHFFYINYIDKLYKVLIQLAAQKPAANRHEIRALCNL